MDEKATKAILAMLNAFPQTAGDPDLALLTYRAALREFEPETIIRTAERFVTGKVPVVNKAFAPSIAEFCDEAREVAEYQAKAKQPASPPLTFVRATLFSRQERMRTRYADREVLLRDVDHKQYLKLIARKELPVGSTWVAALGIVYAPKRRAAA